MEFKLTTYNGNYSEIGQGKREVLFSFYDRDGKSNVVNFFKCKDFAQDVFWSEKLKKEDKIYGFSWSPGSLEKCKFGGYYYLVMKTREDKDKPIQNSEKLSILSLLSHFEKPLGFNSSKFYKTDSEHSIFKYDVSWSEYPYLNSALFLLLRLGFTYDCKSDPIAYFDDGLASKYISPNDIGYFKRCKNILTDLNKGIIYTNLKYSDYTSIGNVHNHSGICNYKK